MKINFFLPAALLIIVCFSCKKDNAPPNDIKESKPVTDLNNIIGRWYFTDRDFYKIADPGTINTISFNQSGESDTIDHIKINENEQTILSITRDSILYESGPGSKLYRTTIIVYSDSTDTITTEYPKHEFIYYDEPNIISYLFFPGEEVPSNKPRSAWLFYLNQDGILEVHDIVSCEYANQLVPDWTIADYGTYWINGVYFLHRLK